MTIPIGEPIQPDDSSPAASNRRRRQRRQYVRNLVDDRSQAQEDVAHKLSASFDFLLFSLISAAVLIIAILLDSPVLYLLAALFIPFLGPVYGLSHAAAIASGRLYLQSLVSVLVAAIFFFVGGLAAGALSRLLPAASYQQTYFYSFLSIPNFVVLTIGIVISLYMLVKAPRQRPLVPNIAVGYTLLLPVGVAGFGLSSGQIGLFPDGLVIFLIHLAWVALLGILVIAVLGWRPVNLLGYGIGLAAVAVPMAALFLFQSISFSPPVSAVEPLPTSIASVRTELPASPQALPPSSTPSPTSIQKTATPTNTLVPSLTPSQTVTPRPTPIWALVSAPQGNGALIRADADGTAPIIGSLLNGSPVQVMGEPVRNDGVLWVPVLTENGVSGWMVQDLLVTETPVPNW